MIQLLPKTSIDKGVIIVLEPKIMHLYKTQVQVYIFGGVLKNHVVRNTLLQKKLKKSFPTQTIRYE